LVFLGTISYPLYLLHYAIGFRIQLLNAALGLPPAVNLFVTIAFAIGLATAVSFLVEHPGKKWVRRMYRSYTMERSLPKLPRVSA
jgi:peptidoglycan/LPS O-acetylase OafA/YrhL